jgi:hypothetical protein
MARLQFLLILFTAFFAVIFSQSNVSSQSNYYPLDRGTQYVYQVTASQKAATGAVQSQTLSAMIVHLPVAMVGGKTVTPEGHYIDGKLAGVTFIADDEKGIYYYANQLGGQKKPAVMDPVQFLIKYPVQNGASWKQQSSGFEMVNDKKLSLMLDASIVSSDEIVTVPAGVFAKCLKVLMTGNIPSVNGGPEFRISNQLWYAPGLGLIKQVQTEERVSTQPLSFTMVLNLQKVVYGE